jgi:hypothetical protein
VAPFLTLFGSAGEHSDAIRQRQPCYEHRTMIELLRTNNPVLISWIQALLADDGIEVIVLDTYMSVIEGSIFAISCRVMVQDDNILRARWLLDAAEIDYDR